jgi:hypothetical protein
MTTRWQEQLEDIKRELARQDEAWTRAMDSLARLGDVSIAVPASVLEPLQGPAPEPAAQVIVGFRA